MPQYRVLLFGDIRAAAGVDELLIVSSTRGEAPLSVDELLQALQGGGAQPVPLLGLKRGQPAPTPFARPGTWADLVRPAVFAVNLEYVTPADMSRVLSERDEIALIPPISGG